MKKVIIIGGGVAGLSAAKHLDKNKFEVTILEASDRLGGRIHTIQSQGMSIDQGAEIVHGKNLDTYKLLKDNGVILLKQSQNIVSTLYFWILRKYLAISKILSHLPDVNMNLKEYLSRLPWHAKLLKMYIVNLETDTEELDKMSAYFAIVRLKYAIDKGEIYGENNFFIKGGYQSLINILQKGQNVFYRSEVELIDYSGEKVKIKTSNTEFEADYVISTVPINVLRNLKFKPQLPESKINIMNHIGVFDVLKVNVIFNEKIGVSEETLNMQADKFINWWQTYDGISHVNQDGWVLWITGPKAREFRTKPESEIIDFINHELSQFVQKPFKILHIDIKDWNKENFIQGAYSNLKPGAPSNTIELMRENVGDRIFFAGEACEIDSSTVHGAYLSGKRVAEELLANENKML